MRGRSERNPFGFAVALALLAAPLILFLVNLLAVTRRSEPVAILNELWPTYPAVLTSLAAGTATMLAVVAVAWLLASLAVRTAFVWNRVGTGLLCFTLALTAIPFLVGPTSFGFLWSSSFLKLAMSVAGVDDRGPATVILVNVLANVLRYAPLLAWLLFAAALDVDARRVWSERTAGFDSADFIRDEATPIWALICLVVAAFAFQDASGDYVITYLALRPSEATGTELASHALQRIFVGATISGSARNAFDLVLVASAAVAALAVLTFMLLSLPILRLRSLSSSYHRRPAPTLRRQLVPAHLSAILVAAVAVAILLPLLAPLVGRQYSGAALVQSLGRSVALSLAAALVSWTAAATIVFSARSGSALADGSAQRRLQLLALVALMVGFIPAIGFASAVQSTAFTYVGTGPGSAYAAWFVAQCLRLIPILAIFMMPAALQIEDRQLQYLRPLGVSFLFRFKALFLSPFRTTHFAFVLVAWNWIVNEGIISAVFQADIPSFSELMLRATSGRSAAYSVAASLVAAEAALFGLLCSIWARQIYSSWRYRHAQNFA